MKKEHSPWMILVTVAIGTLLVGLDKTVVNLALPAIINAFHISISTAGWIATIYMLTNAVFIPIFGKLSDVYGSKKIYVVGFVSFIIVSILTGLSWNIYVLILLRAIQGMVGASIYPASMALISIGFKEKQKRAEALGVWTSLIAGSIVLGPLIGGPLIDHFSWRSVFYINLPIGIIAAVLMYYFLPPNEPGKPASFDYKGTTYMAITLVSLLLVIDQGNVWGWVSIGQIVLYILTVVFGYLFIREEKRSNNPLINPIVYKNTILMSILLTTFISYSLILSLMYVISLLSQSVIHLTATQNGYILLPLLITLSAIAPIGGRLAKYVAPKWIVMLGLIIATIGIFYIAYLPSLTMLNLLFPLGLIGAGFGLTSSPLSTATTTSVPQAQVGMASGLLNLSRNIAGVFGVAFFTILLSKQVSYEVMFFIGGVVMILGIITSAYLKESSEDYA